MWARKYIDAAKKRVGGENHIIFTGNAKIDKFQSESMEIDKYSKPGPKIDEGPKKIVNGNVGQKIYRCRKKKSRGENHISFTGNTKINKFQSESREIDKYLKRDQKLTKAKEK